MFLSKDYLTVPYEPGMGFIQMERKNRRFWLERWSFVVLIRIIRYRKNTNNSYDYQILQRRIGMKAIKLSVRKVVEQVLRCGDIDSRYVDSSVMQSGATAHRKIQKTMGPDYQREVSLSLETEMGGIPVVIQGRADGVIISSGEVTIDEIKTTTLPLDRIYEQRELHLGQAKCYAHMLLQTMRNLPDEVTLQLTYHQLETEEIQRHRWTVTREELNVFFLDLMRRYSVWLLYERDWKKIRDGAIQTTGFPFPVYRRGQRELAVAAYRTIERQKKLYAQAPTGIGKTLSALFPSIKAMGEGKAEKLFYLTAKTVTRIVAEDAVRLMAEHGLRFKSVTLRAKDKLCFQEETVCNPEYCSYARGHYDRINGALLDILNHNDLITAGMVAEYAMQHRVCPYEMALDIALWTDLVICDYSHVFDPVVYLKRFFSDNNGDYVFLIDEAHNLVDRVRDMYTVSLQKSAFYRLKQNLKDQNAVAARLRKSMGSVNQYLLALRKDMGETINRVTQEPDTGFFAVVMQFITAAEEWLAMEQHGTHPLHHDLLELYFEALSFTGIFGLYDERYNSIIEVNGSDITITLFCLDPSHIIAECLKRAKAAILFSATLTPLPYFRDILGGGEDDDTIALPSPFDQNRLLLMAHCGISTKYADRPASFGPIVEVIHKTVSQKRGNYLVYFPSYEYMQDVYELFGKQFPSIVTSIQQIRMDEEERADFLKQFDSDNAETLVGFCVLGGVFSEGIDLKGERLIGTVIVGVGLPKLSLRQDLIRDYFNRKNGEGYDYAYIFPGINKVLQAAGRVIRCESDYGVVLLIDSRFGTGNYGRLYPVHWSGMHKIRTTRELDGLIEKFPFFS